MSTQEDRLIDAAAEAAYLLALQHALSILDRAGSLAQAHFALRKLRYKHEREF